MSKKPDIDTTQEKEMAKLSYREAPKIVTSEIPGPLSKEMLETELSNETPTRIMPNAIPCVWNSAKGATVKDPDGNCFIDLTAGVAVNNVGHCHPKVVETIKRECSILMHNPDATSPNRVRLGQMLQKLAPGDLKGNVKIAYGLSGSSAVEMACKFARGATGRSNIISFQGAYHGALGLTLSLTTSPTFRSKYRPLTPFVYHVGPYAYCYRCPFRLEYPSCDLECAKYVEYQMLSPYSGIDIENTAAMLVESVQGEGGYVPPPDGFLPAIKAICEKAGIIYIDDEVQSGLGRTGKMFAIEHYGVTPDMVTLGKALGGNLACSAVLARKDIVAELDPLSHVLTAAGNATTCAVACTNLELLQDGLLERSETLGNYAMTVLQEMMEEVEIIGDVRGKGLMIAVELVKNRTTKEPTRIDELIPILWALRDKGVLMLPCGRHDNVLRLMPPLVITKKHLDKALEIIREVLKQFQGNILV